MLVMKLGRFGKVSKRILITLIAIILATFSLPTALSAQVPMCMGPNTVQTFTSSSFTHGCWMNLGSSPQHPAVFLDVDLWPEWRTYNNTAPWGQNSTLGIWVWPYLSGYWNDWHMFSPDNYGPFDNYVRWDPPPGDCGLIRVTITDTLAGNGATCSCVLEYYRPCDGDPPNCTTFDSCGKCNGDGTSCPQPTPTPTVSPTPTPAPCVGIIDACGVCNGDSTSCVDGECHSEDLFPRIAQIDANTLFMFKYVERMNKVIKKATNKSHQSLVGIAQAKYLENWSLVNQGIPPIHIVCPATTQCVSVDTKANIKQILKNESDITKIGNKLLKKATKLNVDDVTQKKLKKLLKLVKYLQKVTEQGAKLIPGTVNTTCN